MPFCQWLEAQECSYQDNLLTWPRGIQCYRAPGVTCINLTLDSQWNRLWLAKAGKDFIELLELKDALRSSPLKKRGDEVWASTSTLSPTSEPECWCGDATTATRMYSPLSLLLCYRLRNSGRSIWLTSPWSHGYKGQGFWESKHLVFYMLGRKLMSGC